jgi:hypothetical protein
VPLCVLLIGKPGTAAMKYWEIIADNLSKAGWSWGCVSAIDSDGRTIWIVDAHRDDGKRFPLRALVRGLGVGCANSHHHEMWIRFCPSKRPLFCIKKRSITIALRSVAFRPHDRAALQLTTSGPLSTARHSAS